MATIIPVVKVYGNGVLVKWSGLAPGDTGQEVDVSSFKTITPHIASSAGVAPSIQGSNDTSLPWITLTPFFGSGSYPFYGQIDERYRWLRVDNTTASSTIDVAMWCVN